MSARARRNASAATLLLWASCAVSPPLPDPPADHPASPEAPEAAEPERQLLIEDSPPAERQAEARDDC